MVRNILVYGKSDKDSTIYKSYNLEHASTFYIKYFNKNVSNTYSVRNELKHNINDATEECILYKQFVAWNCKDCSIVPLTDYANNPIYQKIPTEREYFTNADERVYIDLKDRKEYTVVLKKLRRDNSDIVLKVGLKNALTKKMRLRIWHYLQGKYLYLATECRLKIKYRTHSIENEKTLQVKM